MWAWGPGRWYRLWHNFCPWKRMQILNTLCFYSQPDYRGGMGFGGWPPRFSLAMGWVLARTQTPWQRQGWSWRWHCHGCQMAAFSPEGLGTCHQTTHSGMAPLALTPLPVFPQTHSYFNFLPRGPSGQPSPGNPGAEQGPWHRAGAGWTSAAGWSPTAELSEL